MVNYSPSSVGNVFIAPDYLIYFRIFPMKPLKLSFVSKYLIKANRGAEAQACNYKHDRL